MIIDKFVMFINDLDNITAGVYLIIVKIIGAIVFFPGTPLTLLAGAKLGEVNGAIVSIIGNSIGAVVAFFIVGIFSINT